MFLFKWHKLLKKLMKIFFFPSFEFLELCPRVLASFPWVGLDSKHLRNFWSPKRFRPSFEMNLKCQAGHFCPMNWVSNETDMQNIHSEEKKGNYLKFRITLLKPVQFLVNFIRSGKIGKESEGLVLASSLCQKNHKKKEAP